MKRKINKVSSKELMRGKNRRRVLRFSSYITTALIVIAILLGCYLVFLKKPVFNIKNIEVTGTRNFVSEMDLLEISKSRSYGHNILNFNIADFETSLLESFHGARAIKISKKYPSTLKLDVYEREPLAIVHDTERENFFLIDGDGYILGQIEPDTTNFPKISYSGDLEVGYFLEKEVVAIYFELLNALDNEKISASSMSAHPSYVSLYTGNSVEVFVGKDKNIAEVVSALSTLLKQLATEGRHVRRVDLRYDKVIVSYR